MTELENIFRDYSITAERLAGQGVLLMTGKGGNPMTIGWGQLGIIWGKPVFTVMVRPSRHSHSLIETEREFTVNVMPEGSGRILGICGSKSGRDMNKMTVCELNPLAGESISVPGIAEAEIVYECRIVHVNELVPASMPTDILDRYYPSEDFHSFYFGEVLKVRRK